MKDEMSKKTFLIFIGIGLLFFTISTALLFSQARRAGEQIAGVIVEVSPNKITIADAQGDQTILLISEQTKIHGPEGGLIEGQSVYTFGHRQPDNTFQSRGIRVIDKQ